MAIAEAGQAAKLIAPLQIEEAKKTLVALVTFHILLALTLAIAVAGGNITQTASNITATWSGEG